MASHLKEVDEGYFEHLRCAHKYAFLLIMAGIACFAHGLFPNLFPKTASNTMKRITDEIAQRSKEKA